MNKPLELHQELSVGIDEIDAQHQVLLGLVDELRDVVTQGQEREVLHAVLTRLAEYVRIHLAVEESLMQLVGFPGLDSHRQEHRDLILQINALRRRIENPRRPVDPQPVDFLKRWLIKHMIECDQEYARYFQESGGGPRPLKRSWTSRLWNHLQG